MKKLLVAEDDKLLATFYKKKFSKEGFDVKVANNGQEALDMMKTFVPNVMILDLQMPVMNGIETLEKMRKTPSLHDVPVIIATNIDDEKTINKGINLGAKGYVVKSDISLDNFVKKIYSFIIS
jgi:DNA-binding response OmpR family regulator